MSGKAKSMSAKVIVTSAKDKGAYVNDFWVIYCVPRSFEPAVVKVLTWLFFSRYGNVRGTSGTIGGVSSFEF